MGKREVTIGVDPGKKGGIVALGPDRVPVLTWAADERPAEDRCGGYYVGEYPDVRMLVDELRAGLAAADARVVAVVIETPFALAGGGVTNALRIGIGFGHLRAAFLALGWPVDDVTPATWSKAILGSPPAGGWKDGAKKAAAVQLVRTRCPAVDLLLPRRRNAHDGLADAACLALWGMGRGSASCGS